MSKNVKILFAGDTFPTGKNIELFQEGKTGELFGARVCELFKSVDYSVCNLEGCLTDNGEAIEKSGPSVKAPTDTLNALAKLGVKAATLANTHTFDYGKTGHDEMRAALEEYNIDYFGTGDSVDDIKTHITVQLEGLRITLYTVTELFEPNTPDEHRGGANGYDEYAVCNELKELKEHCDYLVVLYHGGAEMTHYNTPVVRKRFHRMADNGADIIISQHTHAVGFEESRNGSYLLYGHGNFCFNLSPRVSEFTATGILLEVEFSTDGFSVQKHIVRRTETGCVYDDNQDFTDFNERSALHKKLMSGDAQAKAEFDKQFSGYCTGIWMPRLLRVMRGINPEDDQSLEGLTPQEASKYLLSKYDKRHLMAIQMMLENEEFNEIAACFIREAIKSKE